MPLVVLALEPPHSNTDTDGSMVSPARPASGVAVSRPRSLLTQRGAVLLTNVLTTVDDLRQSGPRMAVSSGRPWERVREFLDQSACSPSSGPLSLLGSSGPSCSWSRTLPLPASTVTSVIPDLVVTSTS